MSRYEQLFSNLQSRQEGAFVPFVVVGDYDLAASKRIIRTMIDSGADALELGFPFSDPLADGPTIQNAMDRALAANVTPASCFEMIAEIRKDYPDIPVGLLVYANLVYACGLDSFYRQCQEVGIDSVLIADVPLAESAPFCQAAKQAQVAPILLCPPNIEESEIAELAEQGQGYTYLLSRAGVTGTNVAAGMPVDHLLQQLQQHQSPPPLLGFGISQPDHVQKAIQSGAAGVIVGSAIVQRIEKHRPDTAKVCSELAEFVREMKKATLAT